MFGGRRTAFDVDIDMLEDKPWRKPGVDISDYFNYGFDEHSWRVRSRLRVALAFAGGRRNHRQFLMRLLCFRNARSMQDVNYDFAEISQWRKPVSRPPVRLSLLQFSQHKNRSQSPCKRQMPDLL